MLSFMGLMNGTTDTHTNVSCTCDCKRSTSFQSMAITQLEFVQILVIVVVMMMMVVVITCLLNHYRLSARSLMSRHGRARGQHLPLSSEGSLWSSDVPGSSATEQAYTPRPPDRMPSYIQRERLSRFQPTYPYLPHAMINLPPTISLSDGEEPPPYQGPCTLQLRDPEQQLELNRESVRAPPNRTVFDSPLIDASLCMPSANAGISIGQLECAPPAYSEVIGHYYHPTSLQRHTQTQSSAVVPPAVLVQGVLQPTPPQITRTDIRNARNKEKHKAQQV